MQFISIPNDIRNTTCPNAVNERGRKICPITMTTITQNNSILIDGVLYNTKGFKLWVKSELERDYDRLCSLCAIPKHTVPTEDTLLMNKAKFVRELRIRSPMTNAYYNAKTASTIYDVFVDLCGVWPIYCVYVFVYDLSM
jgi:hypothetical protein